MKTTTNTTNTTNDKLVQVFKKSYFKNMTKQEQNTILSHFVAMEIIDNNKPKDLTGQKESRKLILNRPIVSKYVMFDIVRNMFSDFTIDIKFVNEKKYQTNNIKLLTYIKKNDINCDDNFDAMKEVVTGIKPSMTRTYNEFVPILSDTLFKLQYNESMKIKNQQIEESRQEKLREEEEAIRLAEEKRFAKEQKQKIEDEKVKNEQLKQNIMLIASVLGAEWDEEEETVTPTPCHTVTHKSHKESSHKESNPKPNAGGYKKRYKKTCRK